MSKFFKNLLHIFSHNIGLKLLAIVISFIVWVIVINSQDPVSIVTFYDVPVSTINVDSLTEKDKIPEIIEGKTVTVSVEARKSVCDRLTAADILAVADFSKISITDSVPIDVSVINHDANEVDIIRGHDKVMKLSLEDYSTKEFRVMMDYDGETRDGYVVSYSIASPNMISVSGSKTTIGSIAEIRVKVDVANATSDLEATYTPYAYDNNGEQIDSAKISFSTSEVDVKTSILRTRTVNLAVVTSGNVAPEYEITGVSVHPSTITVAGTTEDLLALGSTISTEIFVEGAATNIERNINIETLLDPKLESIMLVENDSTMAITIHVSEMGTKDIYVSAANLQLYNLPEGFDAQIKSISARKIVVQAPLGKLDAISAIDIMLKADLSACTAPGDYTIPVIFETPQGISVKTDVTVLVTMIEEQREQSEQQE